MTAIRTLIVCMTALLTLAVSPVLLYGQDLAAQERAESAIQAGRYDDAIAILNQSITPDSRDTRALLLRARAHSALGNNQSAESDYRAVLELDPASQEALDGLARVRSLQTTTQGSLGSLRRLVESNPDNLAFRIRFADALFDSRVYDQAAAQYSLYLERMQGTPDIIQRYLIAIANYRGDNTLGESVAEKYTRIYTTNDDIWMRLGYFRLWQGDYVAGLEACEQALRLNPANREAGDCALQARNPDIIARQSTYPIDILFRELRANPDDDAKRFQLVDLLSDAGRYFESKQQLDLLKARHEQDEDWIRRNAFLTRRLAEAPSPQPTTGGTTTPTRPRTEFIVDRLYRELRANPGDDERRFRLVGELLKYNRFQEAYDQLQLLEDGYGDGERWLAYFVRVDDGLIASTGRSPIFPIDRLTYRLRYDPADAATRYALVDALAAEGRAAEALDILTDPRYSDPADTRYQSRIRAVSEARLNQAREDAIRLESRLTSNPDDVDALRQITEPYLALGRDTEAFEAYARLLGLEPANDNLRARFAEALRGRGYLDEALRQAGFLLDRQADNPSFQRLYVLTSIAKGSLDAEGERYAERLMGSAADDPELLLDLAQYRLIQGRVEEADNLVRRADAVGDDRFTTRIRTVAQLVSRERIRLNEASRIELLNEARRLAAARRFDAAIDAYEDYFDVQGRRSRSELKELAQVHTAAADYVSALSILTALQDQAWEYDVAKEIARNQIYREDYSGSLRTLADLQEQNPRDFEVRFLQADAYRELGLFTQAEEIYADAQRLAEASESVQEREFALDLSQRRSLAESDDWRGADFAGVIVPTTDGVSARGGGTRYDRWAQGMQAHITLPVGYGAVIMAGVNSHFLSGTRQLVPGAAIARGRVNQVFAAGYLEFTRPEMSIVHAAYTNRLSGEVGLYDYEGGRTVGYGGIRYWRQELGQYRGTVGLRVGEGSIDLWSPAGGEYNLRLSQLSVEGWVPSVMPDSTLRLHGAIAFNVVTDNFGTAGTTNDTNYGTNLLLEASYKVVPRTWFGITYYGIDYRATTDLYFSPRNYTSYDMFLEYESMLPFESYLRIRGAMGIVARSAGFVGRRIELDWIKKLRQTLTLNVVGALGQSTRTLGSGASSFIDRYNTATLSAALYWTL